MDRFKRDLEFLYRIVLRGKDGRQCIDTIQHGNRVVFNHSREQK